MEFRITVKEIEWQLQSTSLNLTWEEKFEQVSYFKIPEISAFS